MWSIIKRLIYVNYSAKQISPGKKKTESHVFKYVVIDRHLTHWLPGFFEHFIGLQKLVIEFDHKDNNDDDNCNNSD